MRTFNILLFDIKGFSTLHHKGQVFVKDRLMTYLKNSEESQESKPIYNITGDGYYVAAPPTKKGFSYLLNLIAGITDEFEDWVEFRFLLHYGDAEISEEIHGEKALIGGILNESSHVLEAIGGGSLVSISIACFMNNLGEPSKKGNNIGAYMVTYHELRTVRIKHGRELKYYIVSIRTAENHYGQSMAEVASQNTKQDAIQTKDIKLLIETLYHNKKCVVITDVEESEIHGFSVRYTYLAIEAAPKFTRYFLYLGRKCVRSKTIEHFTKNNTIGYPLTVLANSPYPQKDKNATWKSNLLKTFKNSVATHDLEHLSCQFFDEFIWDEIIPAGLKGTGDQDAGSDTFVEPTILNEMGEDEGGASARISQWVLDNSRPPIALLVGQGGWGKTTLLRKAYRSLMKVSEQSRKIILFIDAQSIVKGMSNPYAPRISSLADIILVNGQIRRGEISSRTNPIYFEDPSAVRLAISSGTLVVIIDGIDEIASRSNSPMSLVSFLRDLLDLHSLLNHSKMLLAMRDNYWQAAQANNESNELLGEPKS
ncbi:MAG: ATP-binding protein [Bacteroidia bacterium]